MFSMFGRTWAPQKGGLHKRTGNNRKKLLNSNISSICSHNMVNVSPLAAEIGPVVWGHPCEFQRVSRLGSVSARLSSSGRQLNFAALNRGAPPIFVRAAITLDIGPHSLYSLYYIHCVANFNGFRFLVTLLHGTQYWASAKLCGVEQRAPPIFGRAVITLGIGPHF